VPEIRQRRGDGSRLAVVDRDLLFPAMKEVAMRAAIFYATREGQGKRVAEHIAGNLRAMQCDVDVCNVKDSPESIDTQPYQLAFVVASVHMGRHEREIVRFVKSHRVDLVRLGAPFLSLTLSEAGAEDPAAPPEKRKAALRAAGGRSSRLQ
jgi:menaquinone-dependent protoporphyrinogen IX oxidase